MRLFFIRKPVLSSSQMTRCAKRKRVLLIIVCVVLLLAILVGAFGAWFVYRTLPQTSGIVSVHGLQQRVTVGRDTWGVPYIKAATLHDLLFAQGYVTAQDRLFQMEMDRHIIQGRLAEIFGAGPNDEVLDTDILMRTLGLSALIQSRLQSLDAQTRAQLQAYADGVNAFLDTHKGNLPIEFTILGITPAPWTLADDLAPSVLVVLSLDTSWYWKYTRALIQQTSSNNVVNALFPPYPKQNPVLLSHTSEQQPIQPSSPGNSVTAITPLPTSIMQGENFLRTLLGSNNGNLGSNSWVVDGTRTVTGKPLLANDPHLQSSVPATWYEVALHCGQFNVIGFSLPGAPGVVIGHNDAIAWGITSTEADSADLYLETLDTNKHPGQYLYNGKWLPLQTHKEVISLRDSKQPITITVFNTQDGPLLNTALNDLKHYRPVALKWTLFQPAYRIANFIQLDAAQNWSQFTSVVANISLCQNFTYADVQGNIGYRMSGLLPIRPKQNELQPVDGSTSIFKWRGYVPPDQMPTLFNPPSHIIVTANNPIVPPDTSLYVTSFSDYGYRAQRITDLLQQTSKLSISDYERIQADVYAIPAALLTPSLIAVDQTTTDTQVHRAVQLLKGWNFTFTNDSAAAALFEVTVSTLVRNLLEPVLGKTLYNIYQSNYSSSGIFTVLVNLIRQPIAPFFGVSNPITLAKRNELLVSVLQQAMQQLESWYGQDTGQWHWGNLHQANFSHPLATSFPLNLLFQIPSMERPGNTVTINIGGDDNFTADPPSYQQYTVSSMREIIDLAHYDTSLWILPTGQSGQPFSSHYHDLTPLWNHQQYQKMLFSTLEKKSTFQQELILVSSASTLTS